MKKLGSTQAKVLACLIEHREWHDSAIPGWVWDSRGGTRRRLDQLVARGLAFKNGGTYYPTGEGVSRNRGSTPEQDKLHALANLKHLLGAMEDFGSTQMGHFTQAQALAFHNATDTVRAIAQEATP